MSFVLTTNFFSPVLDGTTTITGTLNNSAATTNSGSVTNNSTTQLNGQLTQNIVTPGASDIDCSAGNYFTKTINGATTFTFSNAPTSKSYAFTLELNITSGSVTWPVSVVWPSNTAPTLTAGKTSLFVFVTDDTGTKWRGSSLVDYTT